MSKDFYDKVAGKFGNYNTPAKFVREYFEGDPEDIFKQKLLEVGSPNKVVLDVGCADGRFTLSIASNFKRVVAIDTSEGMLAAAKRNQKELGIGNIDFVNHNVHAMTFAPNSFDVVYSRRGPTDYPSFKRILKPGGYFLDIDIGEKDTQGIKEIFGRGQNYGKWNESVLIKDKEEIRKEDFEVIYAKEFEYNEYYPSYKDLDIFLQGVPLFEDYDTVKDKRYLEEYIKKYQSKKGINLPRHRVVTVSIRK